MLKSKISKRTYKAIYRLLNRVSPLDSDCGLLCGAICCRAEDEQREMGIYLLPGEEKIHDPKDPWLTWEREDAEDYDFPDSWRGKVCFVNCKGPEHCKRELRPFQCRTFPLAPHLTEDGELLMIYDDMALPYRCPLIDEEMELTESFVKATTTVWRRLIQDPLIYDLVREDSKAREEAIMELESLL